MKRWDDLAGMRQLAEELLQTGAWAYSVLFPFQTIAGVTAACAGDWPTAERHHLSAVHQTDSAPYRHLQPVAREWYARMLLQRGRTGDRDRARSILRESIDMYASTGFPQRGAQAKRLLETP
jgi:hypothetical protein